MDNQELLNQLKESVNKHDEIIAQEKINAAEKEHQEQQEKQQKEIEEFNERRKIDRLIFKKFKEFLPKAVEKGCFRNVNGTHIIEGYIDFRMIEYGDSIDLSISFICNQNHFECFVREDGFINCAVDHPKVQLVLENAYYRNLFRKKIKRIYTKKNIFGKFKGEYFTIDIRDDIEEIDAFINSFNSEFSGVAHITENNYKENNNRLEYYSSTDYEWHHYFYFEAEF